MNLLNYVLGPDKCLSPFVTLDSIPFEMDCVTGILLMFFQNFVNVSAGKGEQTITRWLDTRSANYQRTTPLFRATSPLQLSLTNFNYSQNTQHISLII